jgi:predicted lipoprotein with Yx(FWY)xxD motif
MFQPDPAGTRHPRRRARTARITTVALTLTLALAASALAASSLTLGSAANAKLGKRVALSPHGRTLYALTPETTHHLLCTSSECMKFWPPVTVPSRSTKLKDGAGLHGHLATFRRSNGMLQVTLNGIPLYRFSGDEGRDESNGEGIESFGGVWYAVSASGGVVKPKSGAASPSPVTPGY